MKQHFDYLLIQDFLNYSTAVKVPLELLANGYTGPLNDQQKEIIQIATKALDEHVRILQDYAIVVKFDPQNILLTKSKFLINEIVEQILSNLDLLIKEKKIKIKKPSLVGSVQVELDKNHMSQMFQLLISHAISRTPADGEISISVDFLKDNSKNILKFCVQDGGPTLDPEELKLMIDRFEQARVNKVSLDKNISLTLCKMIIEAHSGKFWAESSETVGNCYIGMIPLV